MIKKVLGVIFIIISVFLGLAFLVEIPNNINLFLGIISANFGYSIGYFTGHIIVSILLLAISITLFKLGLKWLKNKPKQIEIINDIGKS